MAPDFITYLDPEIMLSGFGLGLFIGISTDLINKIISAFARWVSSW